MHTDHTDPDIKGNAKVYISNINKNIDEQTFRKKFQQFGPIRSCILKKKPNDVTYSFIQYERPADAARAISQLNSTMVWDRNLKVEYGLGGKKGFQHYLSDAERDKRFGEHRVRRRDSEESIRGNRESYDKAKRQYKRRSNSRDHNQRSYSPIKNKQHRKSKERKRHSRQRIRPTRDSRDRLGRDHRGRVRDSLSRDSRDSYYREHRYRERRDREYQKREVHRNSQSRSSQKRRRSREKVKRYEPYYKDEFIGKRSFEKKRSPESYHRYNSREKPENYKRLREISPSYEQIKRYSPRGKIRKNSRSPSQSKRRNQRVERVERTSRYQKNREETRQRYEPRDKKTDEKLIQKREKSKEQSKRREKYDISY